MPEKVFAEYKGWKVSSLVNPWIKLHVAPQLGGRIIQMELDGYDFLFSNPALEGYVPTDADKVGRNGTWLNFGGEKIWPAPQGWGSPDLWPGPPDPVLDSGTYTLTELDDELPDSLIRLVSQPDPYTGLEITKEIVLSQLTAEVVIKATFKNKSDTHREWSIWPVFQINTPDDETKSRYRVTCPVHPGSRFKNGYLVMHGLVNNPQYVVDAYKNLLVDYQYLVGKIGLDSNSGWVAFTDRKVGKVLVASFHYMESEPYPENTTVQIWTQGRGMIYSRNQIIDYADNKDVNPSYLELELLSPLYKIPPGQCVSFTYSMLLCTIPEGTYVISKTAAGVIASPLAACLADGRIHVSGKFGVFAAGILRLHFEMNQNGVTREFPTHYEWKVNPEQGISIDEWLNEDVEFQGTVQAHLSFYTAGNLFSGKLDSTELCRI